MTNTVGEPSSEEQENEGLYNRSQNTNGTHLVISVRKIREVLSKTHAKIDDVIVKDSKNDLDWSASIELVDTASNDSSPNSDGPNDLEIGNYSKIAIDVSSRSTEKVCPDVNLSGGSTENELEPGSQHQQKQQIRKFDSICSICLAGYEDNDVAVWSSNSLCPHMFHEECIFEWISQGRTTCPCCRRNFIKMKDIVVDRAELINSVLMPSI